MEQLSSCYFCGAALDAQIEPYQVIPPQLEPDSDQQRAVSLCPSCRQKLATVVETVVDATDAETGSAVDDVTPVEPEEPLLDEAETDAPDDETADADQTDDDTETVAEAASAESVASRDADNRGESFERANSGQSAVGTERQTETATGQPSDRSTQSDPLSSDRSDETDEGQSATHANPAGQSRDDDQSAATETTPASEESATDDAEPSDDGPSLTALEYNKVMRLLQNREFPVERAEIHEVATSAYQISDREFDAIIDAAIERGLIDEEDGQLVSGD